MFTFTALVCLALVSGIALYSLYDFARCCQRMDAQRGE